MDNLPRQTTDGKLISPYLWARSDANRFFAAMAKYDRDAEPETDERSAADEAYAGLVIAENLITRYGTAEERIERGYQKAWAKAISDMGLNCPKCGSPDIFEYTSFDGQLLHCKKCDNNFTPKTKKQKSVLLPIQKRDVIAEREALKRAERNARPKTEWLEELDYA